MITTNMCFLPLFFTSLSVLNLYIYIIILRVYHGISTNSVSYSFAVIERERILIDPIYRWLNKSAFVSSLSSSSSFLFFFFHVRTENKSNNVSFCVSVNC